MSARSEPSRNSKRIDELKVPPQAIEAEQAVLGGLMLSPESINHLGDLLTDADFYLQSHRVIYKAIIELSEKNQPYDAITISEWLQTNNLATQVGGTEYLIDLVSQTPSAANIKAWAEIVREKSILRQMIEAGTAIVNNGFDPDGREIKELLADAEQSVFKIAEQGARAKKSFVAIKDAAKEAYEQIVKRYDNQGSLSGLPTGFTEFDEMTSGLQKQDLIILAARPAMGKCLSADAEIVLSNGSIATIEQICRSRGGTVSTLADSFRLGIAAPSDFVDDGIKPTFEVTTRLGRRVESTAPHPYLTIDGWKPLLELKEGDFIAVPRTLPVFGDQSMRECEITLLAYLIGDGGLTGSMPKFTSSNAEITSDFLAAVNDFGGIVANPTEMRESFSPSWRVAANDQSITEQRTAFSKALAGRIEASGSSARRVASALAVSPSSVTNWVKGKTLPDLALQGRLCSVLQVEPADLGMLSDNPARRNSPNPLTLWLLELGLMGHGVHHKFVPSPVFRLPKIQLAHFLNRLFATDGWASTWSSGQAQIGYSSVSERLARQVQHLLLRFGIVAKLRQRWIKYRDTRRVSWQLDITDAGAIRQFIDEIGIHGKQAAIDSVSDALEKRGQHGNVDLIPVQVWERIERSKGAMSWAELARLTGYNESNSHVGRRAMSRERLHRIATALQDAELAALATSDVVWDRIESIVVTGEKQVYDLTIPETHNFIANDICVHNTTLALNIAEYAALKTKKAVAVYSMEMSAGQLAQRLLSSIGRINANNLRSGSLEDEDWSRLTMSIKMLTESKIFIDDTPAMSPHELAFRARRLKREHDLGLIVVDYLQLMQVPGNKENRATEISEISRSLKALAKELDIPIIALSQLNRGLESRTDKRPIMSDLRESGGIEQDADIILFIYRDEYYNKDSAEKGLAEIIISKHRNGSTGSFKLKFFGEYTRFDNLAHDHHGSFE
ncbi:MAG TPA: replicative DNA helicase [Arenimonas sp.]|nr:replicative DNA helicase [Arenimonas sp.]